MPFETKVFVEEVVCPYGEGFRDVVVYTSLDFNDEVVALKIEFLDELGDVEKTYEEDSEDLLYLLDADQVNCVSEVTGDDYKDWFFSFGSIESYEHRAC